MKPIEFQITIRKCDNGYIVRVQKQSDWTNPSERIFGTMQSALEEIDDAMDMIQAALENPPDTEKRLS